MKDAPLIGRVREKGAALRALGEHHLVTMCDDDRLNLLAQVVSCLCVNGPGL